MSTRQSRVSHFIQGKPRDLHCTLRHVDEPEVVERVREATAMCDEPEAISDGIVSWAETNLTRNIIRRAAEIEDAREVRKSMTVQQRLRAIRGRAKQQRVNVSGELNTIEQIVARAASGGRRIPETAMRRVEALEGKLDGAGEVERILDSL